MAATLTVLIAFALLWASPTAFQAAQSDEDEAPEAIACGDTIYSDDFSDPESGWLQRSNESLELGYTDEGAYRMATSVTSNVLWSWAPIDAQQLAGGFCMSARVQAPNRPSQDDGKALAVGLAFSGEPNVPSLHTFSVAPASGVYRVRDRDFEEGISTNVADWTQADAVRQPATWNRLQIRVRGSDVQFYVNGERVKTAEVDASGAVGVFLESFDSPNVSGLFDDFRLRALAD